MWRGCFRKRLFKLSSHLLLLCLDLFQEQIHCFIFVPQYIVKMSVCLFVSPVWENSYFSCLYTRSVGLFQQVAEAGRSHGYASGYAKDRGRTSWFFQTSRFWPPLWCCKISHCKTVFFEKEVCFPITCEFYHISIWPCDRHNISYQGLWGWC